MHVTVADPLPSTSIPLAGGVTAPEVFVVMFHELSVFLAVLLTGITEIGTAREPAGSLWFCRHTPFTSLHEKTSKDFSSEAWVLSKILYPNYSTFGF